MATNAMPEISLNTFDALSRINKSNPEFDMMKEIPREIPKIRATPTMSAAPAINESIKSVSDRRYMIPMIKLIKKNHAASSGNDHCPNGVPVKKAVVLLKILTLKSSHGMMPKIMTRNAKTNKMMTTFRLPVKANVSTVLLW